MKCIIDDSLARNAEAYTDILQPYNYQLRENTRVTYHDVEATIDVTMEDLLDIMKLTNENLVLRRSKICDIELFITIYDGYIE